MCFVYRKPFLALLGDRFSYSYFSFNRRSENQAQVTYRASLGKPIVPIVVEWRSLVNLSRIIYGGRHLISMEEPIFSLGYHNRWRHWLDPYAY